MTSGNGASAPATTTQPTIPLAVQTLTGDIRDAVLSEFKWMDKPWQQMNEEEQERVIHRASDIADSLVMQVVAIVAADGLESLPITVGKFTVDGSEVKGTFESYASDENIIAIRHLVDKRAMFVLADPEVYHGERKPAEPEVVGDLKLPKTGPGAPSDPKAEKQIGRGKGKTQTDVSQQPF